jgi:hypothetical protein
MTSAAKLLAKCKFSYFYSSYSPTYSFLIKHHVLSDQYHPLFTRIYRKHAERKRAGLWWHVTMGLDSSKTKVVRTWLRRRLRNAFIDELEARNISEDGKLGAGNERAHLPTIQGFLQRGESVSLEGSVKLHAQTPLVAAKYADVRKETGMVIDALLEGLEMELKGRKEHAAFAQRERPRVPNRSKMGGHQPSRVNISGKKAHAMNA